mmetsp:Transcript_51828/g.113582  ORF Transcript_51828/g.113582 Transcript_51828/m.113582 type:complete len:366 (-) Transcript_51828:66-1163(-)
MAPSMKRPASASSSGPAKKLAVDPALAGCDLVSSALADADGLREMLEDFVVGSLGVAKDARHPCQTAVVKLIGEGLEGIQGKLTQTLAEAQAKVDGADADKVARDAAVTQASAALATLEAAVAECKTTLNNDVSVLKEADATLKAAEATQKEGDAVLDAVAAKKTTLETAVSEVYEPLKERAATNAEVKKLAAVGAEFSFDPSLLGTLPATLKKAPETRGKFDGITLEQLEGEFSKNRSEMEKELEAGQGGKTERAAAVEAAKSSQNAAVEKKAASVSALEEARSALRKGEAELDAAQKAVANYYPDLKVAADALDDAKSKLESFNSGALAAFRELKDRATPVPEAVEVKVDSAADETLPEQAAA